MVLPWNKRSHELKQAVSRLTNQVNTLQRNLTFEMGLKNINDSIALYPEWGINDHIEAYSNNDQIFSVLNKVAETAAMISLSSYIKKPDEKAFNKYKNIRNRQFYTAKALWDIKIKQVKALEDLPDTDPLNKLLDHPNPFQSKFEFFFAAFIYYLLKECFIYKFRLGEGANGGNPYQLYIFPPQCVNLLTTKTFPRKLTGYQFIVNGAKVLDFIPVEDIIHIKRFNPGLDLNGEDLRGLSIGQVARKLFTMLDAEDDITAAQMQNGGLPGVLFDESVLPDQQGQEQLDAKRKKFYDFVNEPENKGAAWMTGGKLGYIVTGLKLADMEIQLLTKAHFARLCNMLKVSDSLFNNGDNATLDNLKLYTKELYTVAALPLVYRFTDKFNSELVNEFSDKKPRFVDCDVSEITELQEDMKHLAESIAALPGGYTLNEVREMASWDRRDEPFMDFPILKQGYVFAQDAELAPVDVNLLQE